MEYCGPWSSPSSSAAAACPAVSLTGSINRNLGFILDSHLMFFDQIFLSCLSCMILPHSWCSLHPACSRLQYSSCHWHIICTHTSTDYCNSLYNNLPKTQLNCHHHIQNSLARATVAAPRSSNPHHILRSLHCLKVRECIKYKKFPPDISFSSSLFQYSMLFIWYHYYLAPLQSTSILLYHGPISRNIYQLVFGSLWHSVGKCGRLSQPS